MTLDHFVESRNRFNVSQNQNSKSSSYGNRRRTARACVTHGCGCNATWLKRRSAADEGARRGERARQSEGERASGMRLGKKESLLEESRGTEK